MGLLFVFLFFFPFSLSLSLTLPASSKEELQPKTPNAFLGEEAKEKLLKQLLKMGKLQSKHACKRRENPEGDSFVVNAYLNRQGLEEYEGQRGSSLVPEQAKQRGCRPLSTELLNGELKSGQFLDDQCPLEVVLPPEKIQPGNGITSTFTQEDGEKCPSKETSKGTSKKRLNFDDMSSLMHTIYEVVDASVNQSSSSSKTLRVKLTVTPEPSQRKKDGLANDRESSRSRNEVEHGEEMKSPDKRLSAQLRYWRLNHFLNTGFRRYNSEQQHSNIREQYCVDENTERRNHYLDLAGIENYTSKFGPGSPPLQTLSLIHI